jgi:hypothetical protein
MAPTALGGAIQFFWSANAHFSSLAGIVCTDDCDGASERIVQARYHCADNRGRQVFLGGLLGFGNITIRGHDNDPNRQESLVERAVIRNHQVQCNSIFSPAASNPAS